MKLIDRFRAELSTLNRREAEFSKRDGLSLGGQLVAFALSILIIYFRCPSDLSHAQFFAEDGRAWYANAYNLGGLQSLFLLHTGYLVIVQRLGAWFSLFFNFASAPLAMTLVGTLFQWLPVAIFVSPRCRKWAPLSQRVFWAAIYMLMPNVSEIHVVLTNSMWHLAFAAILLAFSAPPKTWGGLMFDSVIFILTALSGPFGILLAPVVFVFWYLRRQRWSLAGLALLSLGGFVQLYMLHRSGNRVPGVLGATPELFVRLTAGNVFLSGLLGASAWGQVLPLSVLTLCFLGGLGVIFYFLRYSNLELRLFAVCCGGISLASLRSPLVKVDSLGLWHALLGSFGTRYWFFATLLFLWACCWCSLSAPARSLRRAGALALLILPLGIARDWRYASFGDQHLDVYEERLKAALPGERIEIPIAPRDWTMVLVKR